MSNATRYHNIDDDVDNNNNVNNMHNNTITGKSKVATVPKLHS
jgi:hypothetical protein